MKIILHPAELFGTVNAIGHHCKPESMRDVEDAYQSAERDLFETLYLYIDTENFEDGFRDWLDTAMREFAEQCDESDESDESSVAEYVSSFGYGGEALHEVRFSEIEDAAIAEALEAKLKTLSKRDAVELLTSVCDLQLTHGVRRRTDEIYAMIIGETEHQIPDLLAACLEALTPDHRKAVCSRLDVYIDSDESAPEYAYSDRSYDRWSMVLDEERAREALGIGALDLEQVKAAGRERGKSIASWVDLPELGSEVSRELAREAGIGETVETVEDAAALFMSQCADSESCNRDYSPFEFTAKDLNVAVNSEDAWAAFDEGISEGFNASWAERSVDFYAEDATVAK